VVVAALLRTRVGRLVAGLLIALALAVVGAMVVMWPGDVSQAPQPLAGPVQGAEVVGVSREGCEDLAGRGCQRVDVVVGDGPAAGERSFFALPAGEFVPQISVGDRVKVTRMVVDGAPPGVDDPQAQPLSFVDFDRGRALWVLALAFAAVVVALARWQGLRSLAGLAVSLVVVLVWMVPAILDGRPPLLVALVGGLAVMLVTTAVTHGLGLKSAAAMLGAAATLVLIVLLAVLAVEAAQITGLSSDEANLIQAQVPGKVSIQGLVLAGIVVGALGVLDDVTISQASTVLALRRANPSMRLRSLVGEAMTVGRDHLGATVNTLVLAYAGASLPVLLIFAQQGMGFADAVTREVVAQEIVATLVGSIGLVTAVPLTTALAGLLTTGVPIAAMPASSHAH
jgi:uncharacterized membrane protein